ncbi:mitochondrial carrier homolog 2-like [Ischnura elegans]|uniref:mitochondrial carrier homolog 2-like n=1 Tax=Ischnura elegans TaxID=197161 RepID=UPI001ED872CC|nr:mitochondrial carrier homolog 2-like [Ischnura elegans]
MVSSSYKKDKVTWANYVFRYAATTATHPFEYAKLLIQLGHEPIAPWPTKTLFGRPALALPSVFQYVSYIKGIDGFTGCYRGLTPKLCACLVSSLTYQRIRESWEFDWEKRGRGGGAGDLVDDEGIDEGAVVDDWENGGEPLSEEEERRRFALCLSRDVVGRTVAVVVSHPFQVVAVRTMAQFVGGETLYSGLFSSFRELYREGGVLGFFCGLIPRLIGELLCLVISSTATFAINTYLVEDPEIKTYTSATISFLASTVTYPFQVVSCCMAVTKSGLAAGSPPSMLHYTSWTDCWSHLSRTGQLKRGSSLLWRYYTGPQVMIGGRIVPITAEQFTKQN